MKKVASCRTQYDKIGVAKNRTVHQKSLPVFGSEHDLKMCKKTVADKLDKKTNRSKYGKNAKPIKGLVSWVKDFHEAGMTDVQICEAMQKILDKQVKSNLKKADKKTK